MTGRDNKRDRPEFGGDVSSAPLTDTREAMELAQTAQARLETTDAAAEHYGLDPRSIQACSEKMLDTIHRGSCQQDVLWVLEISLAMITAVMAVRNEPLPVTGQVDPASYAMSVLRDIATAARERGLDFAALEQAAAGVLKDAEADGDSHLETYWAINRATASCELAWARSLAEDPPVT